MVDNIICQWKKLTKPDQISLVNQLSQLIESSEIEQQLNDESTQTSQEINKMPGNEDDQSKHYCICGDLLDEKKLKILLSLPPVNLIFTSPPYNAGIDYGQLFNDKKNVDDYINFLNSSWDTLDKVLVPGGRIVINLRDISIATGERLPIIVPLYNHLKNVLKYKYRGTHIWYKGREESSFAWGSWCSSANPSIIDLFEYVLVFQKIGEYPRLIDDINKFEFIENVIGLWKIRPVKKIIGRNKTNKLNHPCPFPIELASRVIKLYSSVGHMVLDPFAGVFSTSIAAGQCGRNSIAIEQNTQFCRSGISRFQKRFSDFDSSITIKEI